MTEIFLKKTLEGKWGFVKPDGSWAIEPQFSDAKSFQEGFAAVKLEGKWGFVKPDGSWAIEPQFSDAESFQEGLASVKLEWRWGFVKPDGSWAIEPQFDDVESFKEGIAPVKLDKKYGFIKTDGSWAIEPQFDYARSFKEGFALVKLDEKRGFIKPDGSWAIEPQFDLAESFKEGFALVKLNAKWGFIKPDGTYLFEPQMTSDSIDSYDLYLRLKRGFENGFALVYIDKKYGFIKTDGSWLYEPQFSNVWAPCEGFIRVELNGKQGFIKSDGTYLVEPVFMFAWDFKNGLAYCTIGDDFKNWKHGVLKADGTYLAEPIYDWMGYYFDKKGNRSNGLEFNDGLVYVEIGKGGERKSGYMKEDGSFLLTPDRYTYAGPFVNGFCKIWSKSNEKYGFFSREGRTIVEPTYEKVEHFENGTAAVSPDGDKWGLIDTEGKIVLEPVYEEIIRREDGWLEITKQVDLEGPLADIFPELSIKHGIANATGVVIEPKYDRIGAFIDGVAQIELDWKAGFMRTDGSFVAEPRFDYVNDFCDGLAEVKYDGKWGFIHSDGNYFLEPIYISTRYLKPESDKEGVVIVEVEKDKYNLINLSKDVLAEFDDFRYNDAQGIWIKTGINKGKWGKINYKGETIAESVFDDIDSESKAPEGCLLAKSNGKWGWIKAEDGTWAIEPTMTKAEAKKSNTLYHLRNIVNPHHGFTL